MKGIIVYGNIASGKTTVCSLLAEALHTQPISLDACRREVFKHQDCSMRKGESLAQQLCIARLADSNPIVFETTAVTKFFSRAWKHIIKMGFRVLMVYLYSPPQVSLARYKERQAKGHFQAPFLYKKKDIETCIEHFDSEQRKMRRDLTIHSIYTPDQIAEKILRVYAAI